MRLKRQRGLDVALLPASCAKALGPSAQRQQLLGLIRRMIAQDLSQRQRQVMTLYYFQKKTMPEIAQILGVSVSSVSHTHSRARNTLRQRLAIYWPKAPS